jgi:hypothetical protein
MSYTPKILINRKELAQKQERLEQLVNEYKNDAKISSYLLDVLNDPPMKFGDLELVLCQPEFTDFNQRVRDFLAVFNIEYQVDC